jgi:hypothetical protein
LDVFVFGKVQDRAMIEIPRTLILDGFMGTSKRWATLAKVLSERVGPTELYKYDTSGRTPIEALGQQLAESVERMGQAVNLVGFSMGGLVIRAARLCSPNLPLHRAAFINSPHGGTHMARLLPLAAVRDMRPDSLLINRLSTQHWEVPSLVIWTPYDQMIIPARGSRFSADSNSEFACSIPFHGWPIVSRGIHRRIADFLSNTNPATDSSARLERHSAPAHNGAGACSGVAAHKGSEAI